MNKKRKKLKENDTEIENLAVYFLTDERGGPGPAPAPAPGVETSRLSHESNL